MIKEQDEMVRLYGHDSLPANSYVQTLYTAIKSDDRKVTEDEVLSDGKIASD